MRHSRGRCGDLSPAKARQPYLYTVNQPLCVALGLQLLTLMMVPRRKSAALRVLCVDDDELMLDFISCTLADFDFDVLTFNHPVSALRYLTTEGDVDVVVSDVMMPEMTGPQLYAACYHHAPALANRFVFVSADVPNARALVDAAAQQVGAVKFPTLISKQFSKEGLLAAVSAAALRAADAPHGGSSRSQRVARDSSF